MPRKQRFKPSRKPKQTNEEIGKATTEPSTHVAHGGERGEGPARERQEGSPDDVADAERRR